MLGYGVLVYKVQGYWKNSRPLRVSPKDQLILVESILCIAPSRHPLPPEGRPQTDIFADDTGNFLAAFQFLRSRVHPETCRQRPMVIQRVNMKCHWLPMPCPRTCDMRQCIPRN